MCVCASLIQVCFSYIDNVFGITVMLKSCQSNAFQMVLYISAFIIPLILTRSPKQLAEMQTLNHDQTSAMATHGCRDTLCASLLTITDDKLN